MKSKLTTEYILPTRIVDSSNNIFDSNVLLTQECSQVYIGKQPSCLIKGKGYIIFDFGMELSGGIRILTSRFTSTFGGKIRIRFGESVSETCSEIEEKNSTNHHSLRDFIVYMPNLADQTFGSTGFRFVRIDFLEDFDYKLVNVYAVYTKRDINLIGQFECDDELLNVIYSTCVHTLELNLQENIFEGIKRDRLVWIGDLQPEVLAFSYLYNDFEIIEKAIEDSIKFNPLPCWFGNIPTYSFWLIEILRIYLLHTQNIEFVNKQLTYVKGVIKQLDKCVLDDGTIDFSRCQAQAREGFFFDWPSNGTIDSKEGNRYTFVYCLNSYKKLMFLLNENIDEKVNSLLERLMLVKNKDVTYKQAVALGNLAGLIDDKQAFEKLFSNNSKGLSTFLCYFSFKSMSKSNDITKAINILKEYYGGMLSRGATSFWEDFDIDWLKDSGRIDELPKEGLKDLHGDFGAWCYKGFRHSLCHGWSVGPISFLIEEIAGIKFSDEKFNKIQIKPNLGHLKQLKVTVPTKYGPLIVKENNRGEVKYTGPKEILVEIIND